MTYAQVLEDYLCKNKCEITKKYMEQWPIGRGNAYIDMMDGFSKCYKNNFFCGRKPDNECFYKTLSNVFFKNQTSSCCKSDLKTFSFLKQIDSEINVLDPLQSNGDYTHQKWHLYVGVIAYLLVNEGESILEKPFRKWPSKALRLWMLENSNIDISDIAENIEKKEKKESNKLIDDKFNKLYELWDRK